MTRSSQPRVPATDTTTGTVRTDGVELRYWTAGQGLPLVFCHEFVGNSDSWAPQVEFFSGQYRVITYNARGYPPSSAPDDDKAYSLTSAVEDLRSLLNALSINDAFVCGLAMGASTALQFALSEPGRVRGMVLGGIGSGSDNVEDYRRNALAFARRLEEDAIASLTEYSKGPARIQLAQKDPSSHRQFVERFASFSGQSLGAIQRNIQAQRPPIYELEPDLRGCRVPTLLIVGDEESACIRPALFMKRVMSAAGLAMLPKTGHTANLEEPILFNRLIAAFLSAVQDGYWASKE